MITGREEEIRARAYAIWEREGRPPGREKEHWEQARREVEAETPAPKGRSGSRLQPDPPSSAPARKKSADKPATRSTRKPAKGKAP